MPPTAEQFLDEGKPVADIMKTITGGYYWSFNFYRDQWMDITNSSASEAEIDEEERTVWSLPMDEAPQHPWDGPLQYFDQILYHVIDQSIRNREALLQFLRSNRDTTEAEHRDTAFRNLTNAWRDEYAVSSPLFSEYDGISGGGDLIDADISAAEWRMKTAEWRLTKCYYALYKSASAIVRTREIDQMGHRALLNTHAAQFMDSQLRPLYHYPLLHIPDNNTHFRPVTIPYPLYVADHLGGSEGDIVRDILADRRERYNDLVKKNLNTINSHSANVSSASADESTVYHLFRELREWASYDHGGIFCRLYGDGFIKQIDAALRLISFSAMTISEVALILSFGYDEFESEYEAYVASCEEGIADSTELIDYRVSIYEQALNGI